MPGNYAYVISGGTAALAVAPRRSETLELGFVDVAVRAWLWMCGLMTMWTPTLPQRSWPLPRRACAWVDAIGGLGPWWPECSRPMCGGCLANR